MSLLQKLHAWRRAQMRKEGVAEAYRVLSNATLDQIAREKPADKAALLTVKGIAEKKWRKYGEIILDIVQNSTHDPQPTTNNKSKKLDPRYPSKTPKIPLNGTRGTAQDSRMTRVDEFGMTQKGDSGMTEGEQVRTVGEFLDFANTVLQEMPARVRGEVSSVDIRGSYLFYTIKDVEEEASLSIFMWRNRYDLCGVALEEGMEVIVEGHAEIYKPSGRFSFRADSVELVGEGALKAAYEKLKGRLEKEGLFAPDRKRKIPHFPQRIGLITSRDGAVIHDFLNNIGRFGYIIRFVDSRVEGQLAVPDLLRAIKRLKKEKLDVLVMIRGGGSLESLQAFNNEALVRELASFPVPVICGIGHDKDVPLASMAADLAVSTPTAATKVLNSTWEQLLAKIDIFERDIFGGFERKFHEVKGMTEENAYTLTRMFMGIVDQCRSAEESVRRSAALLAQHMERAQDRIILSAQSLRRALEAACADANEFLKNAERHIAANDPRRQLRLGYSIAKAGEKVVRSVKDVEVGDEITLLVIDGKIGAKVKKVERSK